MKSLDKFKNYDVALLILRLGFGLGFFFFHGLAKLEGGPERWESLGSVMSKVGIDFGHTFFGFLAAFAESIGAIMIAVGYRMELFALMIGFTMLMASIQHIFGKGSPANAIKYLCVALSLFYLNPGKYSLDHYLNIKV